MHKVRVTTLAAICGGYILIATLYPFEISNDLDIEGFFNVTSRRDFVLNIFLFIPFGGLLFYRFVQFKSPFVAIALATMIGALLSTFIELLQIVLPRVPSVFDILSNTTGTASGALMTALVARPLADVVSWMWARLSGIALYGALIYAVTPFVLSVVQFVGPFNVWNPRFSFQLANETTLNRPWLGKIHFLALYDRALSPSEIRQKFGNRHSPVEPSGRGRSNLIALYTFSEGGGEIVHDSSGFDPPLDLTITPKHHVRWLDDSNGLAIRKPVIIADTGAGPRLANTLKTTHELTIEAWITPETITQAGPARIVSFSRGTAARNFTLGQSGPEINFRVRTPVSGRNGSPLSLTTSHQPVHSGRVYIVATYKDGNIKLYANGEEHSSRLDLTNQGIIGFGTGRTPLALIAYSFFYFFPVTFLLAFSFSTRLRSPVVTFLMAATIGAAICFITELFQASVFDRSLHLPLFGYASLIIAWASFSGTTLKHS